MQSIAKDRTIQWQTEDLNAAHNEPSSSAARRNIGSLQSFGMCLLSGCDRVQNNEKNSVAGIFAGWPFELGRY